ncbi:hypothetical protein ACHQM5_010765 [Ranunculus cassubicifolius]
MSSIRLLQRTLSSLLTVSCRRSKLISLTQIPSSSTIGQSSNLSSYASACAKILDTKTPKEDSSDSAHEKSPDSSSVTTTFTRKKDDEKLKEALERIQDDVKSTLERFQGNEIAGFEVIDVPEKKDTILLKKQAAGETIQILVAVNQYRTLVTVNVGKVDGTCLEFLCSIDNNKIDIYSMLIKEKGHSSNLKDYNHFENSAFKLKTEESHRWLRAYDNYENLGELFDGFLEARGINNTMAEWIENYMPYKREMEKSIWLENVNHFIDK